MENLTTEQPKSTEQILIDFIWRNRVEEVRKSFRKMLFAAFRSEWADDIDDRMEFLAEFENLDQFLEELEIFEAAHLEKERLQRESEEAERKKNLEERLDKKIQEVEIKRNVELKKKRQKLLARVESLKAQIEVWANEQDDD